MSKGRGKAFNCCVYVSVFLLSCVCLSVSSVMCMLQCFFWCVSSVNSAVLILSNLYLCLILSNFDLIFV